jgi:alpha-beta hydrolase superfamily lysophospholipase
MEISEWNWKSFDGLDMYARGWVPNGKPKAVLVLVGGLGEHIGRYEHVAAALTEKGYALSGFDLRGHGKSGGPRGHTPSYEALMIDIASFCQQLDARYAGLPRFLYGHSLGGNLVLNYVLRRKPDLKGVIATGAWLKMAYQPAGYQVALARLMIGFFPGFTQPNHLKTKNLSRDPVVVCNYENDPLVHDRISAPLFFGIYKNGLWALEHAVEFPLPLLLMHGSADSIISAQASQEFASRAGDKATFKLWENLYHEIHNEPEQAQVFTYMVEWLDKQLP